MNDTEPINIQFEAFCKEVEKLKSVWALFKDGNVLTVANDYEDDGVIPLWSSKTKSNAYLKRTGRHNGFLPVEIDFPLFKSSWISNLKGFGVIEAGINWTGAELECNAKIDEVIESVKL